MRKFFELIYVNFRKMLLPLIIIVFATVLLQVIAYIVILAGHEDVELIFYHGEIYAKVYFDEISGRLNFLEYEQVQIVDAIKNGAILIVIMMILLNRETEENKAAIRNLPVSRISLCLAKFIQVSLSIFIVFFASYAGIYLQYELFNKYISEKYRSLFIYGWDNNMITPLLRDIKILLVIAIVISVVYSYRNYIVIRKKMRGVEHEKI